MNVKAVVVESCEKVIKENDESIDVTEETEISRENGIDSVGIVTVICDIEEQLEIQLDEYLSYVRKCKTIGELVSVVEKAVGNQWYLSLFLNKDDGLIIINEWEYNCLCPYISRHRFKN